MALLDEMMMNPQSMGLLGLGSGLLQASGPSRMPITLGQAIGGALPMGVQGAQQAYAMRQQDEMNKLRREMMALEMEQARRAEEARRRQEQGLAMVDDALTERERDVTLPPMTPNDDEGNVNPQIQGRMKTIDQAGALRGLRQAFPQEYAKLMFGNVFKQPEAYTLKPGEVRYVGDKPVAAAPGEGPKEPSKIQEYNFAVQQGFRGSFIDFLHSQRQPAATINNYGSPVAGVDANGNPVFIQTPNRDGPARIVTDPSGQPIRPPANPKPMTDAQSAANLYATRMEGADKIIKELDGKYDVNQVFARRRVGDGMIGALVNNTLSPESQRIDQAQRDFVNAVLRRESGAVISPSEFDNAAIQYFPQPGDSQAVIRQKAQNRRTAIEGLKAAAGGRAPVNDDDMPPPGAVRPRTR